jgi:hypothetical protein
MLIITENQKKGLRILFSTVFLYHSKTANTTPFTTQAIWLHRPIVPEILPFPVETLTQPVLSTIVVINSKVR